MDKETLGFTACVAALAWVAWFASVLGSTCSLPGKFGGLVCPVVPYLEIPLGRIPTSTANIITGLGLVAVIALFIAASRAPDDTTS